MPCLWAVSHGDTSKNTKATLKCCYALHYSYLETLAHPASVSRHDDTSKNTRATLKCYAPHTYAGAVFIYGELFAQQHPPSRNGDKSSEDDVWHPMWFGNGHTRNPLTDGILLSMTIADT